MGEDKQTAYNRRVGQLKRWLSKPPTGAHGLELVTVQGEDTVVLDTWVAEHVRPEIATDVLGQINELAEEQHTTVVANLRWLDADGQPKTQRVYRQTPTTDGWDTNLDGSAVSQARQAQRHHENMARAYIEAVARTTGALTALVQQLGRRVEQRETALAVARDETAEARALLTEVASADGEGSHSAAFLQQLAPLVIQALASANGGTNGVAGAAAAAAVKEAVAQATAAGGEQ
jgi:hypothetical protein